MRKNIDLSDTVQILMIKMSEGNPGALDVLFKLVKDGNPLLMLDLDEKCIMKRSKKMVDFLNKYYIKCGKGWLAVQSGASFENREKLFLGEQNDSTRKKRM